MLFTFMLINDISQLLTEGAALSVTLTFNSKQDVEKFGDAVAEQAMQIEDDGNEGHPTATILWGVVNQLKKMGYR